MISYTYRFRAAVLGGANGGFSADGEGVLKQPIPFGKYYLLERINVGGMAEVFKAKATGVEGFERMVAVKRILPSIAEDEEFITMFVDEAKIAVQLTHANVAQIFDLGKVGDSYFIALEYVHGKDLRAIFHRARQRGEQVPIPMACFVIMKICEGLDYAHNKRDSAGRFLNLVHRDVSPQNLLVSYEGECKIIDFGIALAAGKAGRTQAGILKGKFGYMSPEQVQQGFEIDRRSDVFGVGICLYELLTGERLFVAETDFATLEKVRNVDIMPPSTYNRRIPEDLEQIVLRALARNRDDRHQTAMALHDELQSFMYTSGNFFGRKDLSMYMQRVFAEELSKETARDREYATLDLPALHTGEDESGLESFQEIDPVSTVSALQDGAMLSGTSPAMQSSPQLPRKATLVGMPAVAGRSTGGRVSRPPGPVVPRISPRANSIPPGYGPSASGVRQAAQPARAPGWDDEELATQIYDKPGEGLDALASQLEYLEPARPARPVAAAPVAAAAPVVPATRSIPPARAPRRTAWPILAAVAAVLLLVGVGVWLARPPAPGELRLTTDPPDAQLRIDGIVVGGRSPFHAGNVAPGTTHLIEVVRENYRPWSIKIQLQPAQSMELPEVVLDPVESGFALDSIPSGASVFVDGAKLTDATPVRMTKISPGDHIIRLESDGYAPWESSLHVVAGKVLDLPKAQLTPQTADGQRPVSAPAATALAPTPTPTPGPAPVATTPRKPRPGPRAPRPTFVAQQPAPPAPAPAAGGGEGTLRVQTRPWSKVFIDGQLVGTTPQMGIRLPAGSHTLVLQNDDFGIRKTVPIRIRAGETITKVLTLTE